MSEASPEQPPANWYPDPGGKHEHRYWDGHQWTDNVADHGRQTSGTPGRFGRRSEWTRNSTSDQAVSRRSKGTNNSR